MEKTKPNKSTMEKDEMMDLYNKDFKEYYENVPNRRPWSIDYIQKVAAQIVAAKTQSKKSRREYFLLNTYDAISSGDKYSVIKKITEKNPELRYVVAEENIFQKLLKVHLNTGHGCRDKMLSIISKKYVIPRPCVEMLIRSCKICQKKKSKSVSKTKSLVTKSLVPKPKVVKPIIYKKIFMSKGQMELINFESIPDKEFTWILNYQDHVTKFICLRPLRSKQSAEIAGELLKIFLQFGAPSILQSDYNDGEFTSKVIDQLKVLWPQISIVHESAESQPTVDRCNQDNQDVEKLLRAWMALNNSTNWSLGLHFVQWQKNTEIHSVIGRSPYKAVFGVDAKLGFHMPSHLVSNITDKDEMEADKSKESIDNDDINGEDSDGESSNSINFKPHEPMVFISCGKDTLDS